MKYVTLPVDDKYWSLVKFQAKRLGLTVPEFVVRCIDKYFDFEEDKR